MVTLATPLIAEADYPAFRKVLPSLPPTFDEWQREINFGVSQSPSIAIVGVAITSADFESACEKGEAERSFQGLRNYASAIGLGIPGISG